MTLRLVMKPEPKYLLIISSKTGADKDLSEVETLFKFYQRYMEEHSVEWEICDALPGHIGYRHIVCAIQDDPKISGTSACANIRLIKLPNPWLADNVPLVKDTEVEVIKNSRFGDVVVKITHLPTGIQSMVRHHYEQIARRKAMAIIEARLQSNPRLILFGEQPRNKTPIQKKLCPRCGYPGRLKRKLPY